jgi:hypothetical protein
MSTSGEDVATEMSLHNKRHDVIRRASEASASGTAP